ncbi:MAG: hypothetical protein A2X23_00870 [Chloroflexi bacterium GWC2_73_18]|nr:MAG: hypothetical protein A2X23_00870 [Chloroflexi bacterium GWC2_73_18]
MRAWDDRPPEPAAHAEPVAAARQTPPGTDAHEHEREHGHSHGRDHGLGRPRIGIVGAGRVGTVLGVAFQRAGWPVAAVASRDAERRARFGALVPGAIGVTGPEGFLDAVDLIFLAVPDDAIGPLTAELRLYSGQSLVHTSGLLPAAVLAPAQAAGTMVASFHPLVAFAELERALHDLEGATVALEGDEPLVALLADLAEAIGAVPVRIEAGGKAAYHAAAVLAAGGFVALLDAIALLARGAGLDEAGALAVYAPLIRQSLANAEALGIAAAQTGPIVRGDAGTVEAHVEAMRRLAPGALELYAAAARREIALAEGRGGLSSEAAERLRALLAKRR